MTEEEKEERRKRKNERDVERHRKNGYAGEKKYRAKIREKYKSFRVLVPRLHELQLSEMIKNSGMSVSEFFIRAVEKTYDITLE